MKYRRYVPAYRPDLRRLQTTCNLEFIAAYLDALDEARRRGRRVPIKGFGGWFVAPITKADRDAV